jgi:hypothetical protein
MALLLIHCDSNDNNCSDSDLCYCDTENPVNDLNWLKEIINAEPFNQTDTAEIYYCIYNNIEGFVVDMCVFCPDAMVFFYDCEGNIICEFGGYLGLNTCPDFEENLSKIELIWKRPQ